MRLESIGVELDASSPWRALRLSLIVLGISVLSSNGSQADSALSEWKSLPPLIYTCMKKLVEAAESAPIEKVVAAGIKPSNPGYAPAMQTCNTYANLRRGFSCTLQDQEGNPIETMCDESFAIVQNGQWTKIAPDEALDYIASRSAEVRTIAEETQDGFKKRQTAIAKELPAAGASTDGGSSDQVSPAESGTSGNNTQKQCRDTPSFSDCLMQGMMNGQSSQVYGPSCRARYC